MAGTIILEAAPSPAGKWPCQGAANDSWTPRNDCHPKKRRRKRGSEHNNIYYIKIAKTPKSEAFFRKELRTGPQRKQVSKQQKAGAGGAADRQRPRARPCSARARTWCSMPPLDRASAVARARRKRVIDRRKKDRDKRRLHGVTDDRLAAVDIGAAGLGSDRSS